MFPLNLESKLVISVSGKPSKSVMHRQRDAPLTHAAEISDRPMERGCGADRTVETDTAHVTICLVGARASLRAFQTLTAYRVHGCVVSVILRIG